MPKLKIDNNEYDLDKKITLLENLIKLNINIKYKCKSGSCGSCKCILESGSIKELRDHSYSLTKEELEKKFILSCQSLIKSDITLRIP